MRPFLIAAAMLLAACPFFGQAAHRQGQVFQRGNGTAAKIVPFAQIQVCVAGTGGGICSTPSIYSDFSLTTPITGPIIADSNGNYDYFLAGGCVDELIASPGTETRLLPYVCESPSASGSGTVSSFSSGNLSPLFTTSVSNPSTTPAQTFSLATTPNFTFYGNFSGATTAPSFWTLAAGSNITLTPSGNTLTVSSSGGGSTPSGNNGDVQLSNGSGGFTSAGTNIFNYNQATQTLRFTGIGGNFTDPTLALPGYNWSNGIGTSVGSYNAITQQSDVTAYSQGNTSLYGTDSAVKGGLGDFNIASYNGGYGGSSPDPSAQGMTVIADQMTMSPTKVLTANVSSTGTPSGFPGVTLTTTGSNGSNNFGTGRIIIDETDDVESFTATGVTQAGSGNSVYALVTETGQTYTISKQGSLASLVNGPTAPNLQNLPINATISVTIGSACSAGDYFTIGGTTIESAKILASPAPTYSGGILTFHAWIRVSHEAGAVFFCEGPTGRYLRQDADDTSGNKFLFTMLGATGTNTVAIGRQATATMDAAFIAGSGTDTAYHGAPIVDPRDPSTGVVDGNLTLGETDAAFTPGASLEVPNGLTTRLYRYLVNAQDFNPYTDNDMFNWGCVPGSTDCGNFWNDKRAWINWTNGNPDSAYTYNTPTPGRWTVRGMFNLSGPLGTFAYYSTPPRGAMFEFQNTSGSAFNPIQIDDADAYMQWNNVANAQTWELVGNNFRIGAGTGSSPTNLFLSVPSGSCTNGLALDSTGKVVTVNCGAGGGITQLTGDVTTPSGSGSQPATLATVNTSPGTYGDATHTVTVTVDGKGRATSVAQNAIAPTTLNGTSMSAGGSYTIGAAPTGTAGGDLSGSYPNPMVSKVGGAVVPNSGNLVKSVFGASPGQLIDAAPGVDYEAPPLWAGTCVGQFNFTDTGGATPMVDSCNGFTGSISNVTRTGQGYVVTASPASSLQFPSQVNNWGTVMMSVNFPLYVTGDTPPQPLGVNQLLLGVNHTGGNAGTDFLAKPSFNQALGIYGLGQTNYTSGGSPNNEFNGYFFTGTHILTISCPSGAGPIYYIDGVRFFTSPNTTGFECNNVLSSGNYQVGSTTNSGGVTGTLNATLYSVRFTNLLTDAQVASNTYTMQQQLLSRGVPLSGQVSTPLAPQYVATGDSITCGFTIAGGTSQCSTGTNSSQAYANLLAAGQVTNEVFAAPDFDNGAGNIVVSQIPLSTGMLKTIRMQWKSAIAPGTYTVVITSGTGVTQTIVNSFPLSVTSGGFETYHAGTDFTSIPVTAGEYIGIWAPSARTFGIGKLSTGTDGFWYLAAASSLPSGAQTYTADGETLSLNADVTLPNTTTNAYQTSIYGQSAAAIQTQVANVPWLYGPQTRSLQGYSIASILEGINNFTFQTDTPQSAWEWTQAWGASMRTISSGTRLLVIDLISKGSTGVAVCNGTGGFADLNACRDGYNNIARQSWAASGFAAFDDIGADPLVGCDSCNASAIYFNGDATHPSTAGQAEIANSVGCLINAMDGSTPTNPNPTPITGSSYTATCGDGGLVADASGNNINIMLNSALWQTGRSIQMCNNTLSGSNTVTLTAPSDFPLNNVSGSTSMTITNHSCVNLKSTFNGNTASPGDFWRTY